MSVFKTVLHSRILKIFGFFAACAALVLLPSYLYRPATTKLVTETKTYTLEVMASESARIRGLSGRPRIENNKGLLFVYPTDAQVCMWMKDMKFNIDILWLNDSKEVLRVEKDVKPSSYPNRYCNDYTRYVIELNAGQTEKSKIKLGQKLDIK